MSMPFLVSEPGLLASLLGMSVPYLWMGVGYFLSFRGWRLWPWPGSGSARKNPNTEWPVGTVYRVLVAEFEFGVGIGTPSESTSSSPPPPLKNVLQVVFAEEGVYLCWPLPFETFIFDKPLFVPWENVRSMEEKKNFLRGCHYVMRVEGLVEVGPMQARRQMPMRIRLWLPAKVEKAQEFTRCLPRERVKRREG